MAMLRMSRRRAIQFGAGAACALSPVLKLFATDKQRRYKVGACDWSMGARHDPRAIDIAKRIGLDGVQVSFGEADIKYDLRKPSVRQQYQDKCNRLEVEIASLGLAALNSKPYASDPDAQRWVFECVDVMKSMGQRVALLAFFGKGDIENRPEAQKEVIRRLKQVAPKAERAGVILGIESWLSAHDHLRILDAVGSSAVQVYYDVANSQSRGYDIYQELRQLGRDRICQIHAKENGNLLGKGRVDFQRVKNTLDDIGWQGYLVIEAATTPGTSMEECYKLNQAYLRSVFLADI